MSGVSDRRPGVAGNTRSARSATAIGSILARGGPAAAPSGQRLAERASNTLKPSRKKTNLSEPTLVINHGSPRRPRHENRSTGNDGAAVSQDALSQSDVAESSLPVPSSSEVSEHGTVLGEESKSQQSQDDIQELRASAFARIDEMMSCIAKSTCEELIAKGTCEELNNSFEALEATHLCKMQAAETKLTVCKAQIDREWHAARTSAQYDFIMRRANLRDSTRRELVYQIFDVRREYRELNAKCLGMDSESKTLPIGLANTSSFCQFPQSATPSEIDEDCLSMNISVAHQRDATTKATAELSVPHPKLSTRNATRPIEHAIPRSDSCTIISEPGKGFHCESPTTSTAAQIVDNRQMPKPLLLPVAESSTNDQVKSVTKRKRASSSTSHPLSAPPIVFASPTSPSLSAPASVAAQTCPAPKRSSQGTMHSYNYPALAPRPASSYDAQVPYSQQSRVPTRYEEFSRLPSHAHDSWPPHAHVNQPANPGLQVGVLPARPGDFTFNAAASYENPNGHVAHAIAHPERNHYSMQGTSRAQNQNLFHHPERRHPDYTQQPFTQSASSAVQLPPLSAPSMGPPLAFNSIHSYHAQPNFDHPFRQPGPPVARHAVAPVGENSNLLLARPIGSRLR